MTETVVLASIFVGVAFAIISTISFVLHYFVALDALPQRRAAWTAGLAYVIGCTLVMFAGIGGHELYIPLAAIPAGLVVYWFWLRDFRRAWIDSTDELGEGDTLANNDWRIGVALVVGVAVLALIKGLLRSL